MQEVAKTAWHSLYSVSAKCFATGKSIKGERFPLFFVGFGEQCVCFFLSRIDGGGGYVCLLDKVSQLVSVGAGTAAFSVDPCAK